MRKFNLKKVLFGLSVSLVLAMAIGSFALGETQTSTTPRASEPHSVAATTEYGDFNVTESSGGSVSFNDSTGVLTISGGSHEISMAAGKTSTANRIEVADAETTITLDGVNISTGSGSALKIADNAAFNVTITLADDSTNILKTTANNCAGLEKNGEGTGKLSIGAEVGAIAKGNGKLIATGGQYGVGIGGGNNGSGSNIEISGGEVTATGGYNAAGIGGGNGGSGSNITINGGVVTATEVFGAAGIGGGSSGNGSNITINGGVVTATGGSGAAGIGGGRGYGSGYNGNGSNITISGGEVTATGGDGAAGIGGGATGNGSNNNLNGDAVVIAASGNASKAALQGFDGRLTQGIAFTKQGSSGTWSSTMYGDVTIKQGMVFPANLTVGGGDSAQTLTVADGATLTLSRNSNLTKEANGNIECQGIIKTVVELKPDDGAKYDDITFTYMEANQKKKYGSDLPSGYDWQTSDGEKVNADSDVLLNEHTLYAYNAPPGLKVDDGAVRDTDYQYDNDNKELKILTDTPMTIENKNTSVSTGWRIVIASSNGADLTLNNVNINTSGGAALEIPENYGSNVTITLADNSDNKLITTKENCAGLQKNGNGAGTLTIGAETGASAKGNGKLTAEGGDSAAGIGGKYNSGSNIEISGGEVTATGGYNAAGIGGGYRGSGSGITISGGVVTATGSNGGAGIGGGSWGSGNDNSLNGDAVVFATSGSSSKSALEGFDGRLTQGIAFSKQGSSGTWSSTVYGNSVEITADVEFPANLEVSDGHTIKNDANLTIAAGAELTCSGSGNVETKLTCDPQGGTLAANEGDYVTYQTESGVQKYGTLPTPTKEGYTFDGWYTDKAGQGTNVTEDSDVMLNQHTLYANWNEEYGITISAMDNGSITSDTEKAAEGVTVTLTVTPDTGYSLADGSLSVTAGSGSDVPTTKVEDDKYTFTMPADNVTVSATFEANNYNVTIETLTHGTITSDKNTAQYGQTVTLTVTPDTGYSLADGSLSVTAGSGSDVPTTKGEGDTYTFTMPADNVTVSATFEANDYNVTIETLTGGTITSDTSTAQYGGAVTLTVTPDTGYSLKADSLEVTTGGGNPVEVSGSGSTYTFTMPADNVTVSATFEANNYNVTIETLTHGTITSDTSTAQYDQTVTLTVTPDTGYSLADGSLSVTAGSGSVPTTKGEGDTYTFTMPADNVTVSATFEENSYEVTIDKQDGSEPEKQTVLYGGTVTKPADPTRDGYSFVNWYTNTEGTGDPYDFTTPVESSFTIYAKWLGDEHDAEIPTYEHGKITIDPEKPRTGDTVILTATPDEGYQVKGLPSVKILRQAEKLLAAKSGNDIGDIEVTPIGNNQYSFVMPNGNVEISAEFEAIPDPTPTPPTPGPEPTPTPTPTPDPSVDPDGGSGGGGASSKTGDPFACGASLALLGIATTGVILTRKLR